MQKLGNVKPNFFIYWRYIRCGEERFFEMAEYFGGFCRKIHRKAVDVTTRQRYNHSAKTGAVSVKQREHLPEARHPEERAAFLYIPLLAVGLTLVIELFNHKAFTGGLTSFWNFVSKSPAALAVNTLLVLITLVPALFFRRRIFWCMLVSVVWLAGGAVNGFILLNRMTPFTVADLTVFQTGIDTLPNYLSTKYIILLAAGILLAAAGLILLFWKGPQSAVSGRQRVLSGTAALAVCGTLLAGSWALAFDLGQLSRVFSNLAFAYEDYGFGYCFLQTWLNRGIRQPADYSGQDMDRIGEMIDKNTQETQAQTDVNVIFVQLESFIDPSEVVGLELSEDAVPTWTALKDHFSSGYLTVPVVGAGTANTECEVLTGMRTRLFGPGEYPYQTCLKEQAVETVAYDLKANGYATHAIHNHRATFYGRNKVYANLGFDDFTAMEYMPKVQLTPKRWAKDAILSGQITKALNTTPDQPDLVFTVSVQGHGKYPTNQVLENPAVTVSACPDGCDRNAMEYYVNQIREMDDFVERLILMLSAREEKSILVLYGDHLPALGLESEDTASGSLYRTEYVIWDNFGLEEADENLHAYQLSAAALSRIGITTGRMNAFHQFCREEPTYAADLQKLQYDVLYGERHLYEGENPYSPTELEMGMAPIRVNQILRSGDDFWYVIGENFSPYCQVIRGGKRLEAEYVSPRLIRLEEDPKTEDPGELVIQVVDKHNEILSDTE